MTTPNETSPLLETKLYVPKLRRGLVARQRLSERLSRGVDSKLTLVSAPPGFGKTTLLAEWLASARTVGQSVAWLSLDPSDNQAATFWPYLIAALRTVAPEVGANALSLLQAPQPPPIDTILATLINELNATPNDIVLVLDDYHVIDARDVQDGMAFLLDHLPPRVHIVITSRADPALPLGLLRGRGELVEIRAADLRFTPDETAAYLNDAMGLDLAARDVAALEARTEGWIAALQLAALSMQGRDDIAGFIAGFAGDDRYIVDYLVEEVLRRQPEAVRSFLLQTSILGRLSGPLCDAVTGEDGGKAMLEALDRGNLFLVPLDDRRRWYRYHHLFGDVLLAHLLDEQPDRILELHRRASDWYDRNGDRSEAIRHAMAAEDFDRAADLVELALPAMRKGRGEATVRGWLTALPAELVGRRPVLGVAFAWVLIAAGDLDDVERHLQLAESWAPATDGLAAAHSEESRLVPAMIALYRSVLAQIRGDVPATVRHAQAVLDLAPEDDDLLHGGAAAILGLASWASGDLEAAHAIHAEGMARVQRAGNIPDAMNASIALADIRITQGRLGEAIQTYDQAFALSSKHGEPVLPGTADLHVGFADILREQGDLEAAAQHLQASKDLGEHMGFPQGRHRRHVVTARIREAEGELDSAIEALEEAQRVYVPDFSPDVHPLAARKARVLVRQGRSAEAGVWARERGLSADDDLTYLREFEHITLARLLLAAGPPLEALDLLDRLRRAAEDGQRTGSLIEILVLQALARQTAGDASAALVPLERALALAEPEGYVRVFVDEGRPMAALLEAATKRGIARTYVRRLLAAFGRPGANIRIKQDLVEPLSDRELDVLRLLATDLSGPDIARELVVSLNTVRTHTKNIFSKLGVNSRRAAVSRAAELDLLARAHER